MDKVPFEFRVGSAGIGVWAGCGAGVGILTPVSLHSIPVVGQMASSIATSLRQLDSTFGGIGWRINSALNTRAKTLGLRAGTGCGVAIGYGWGAGLMLKPTALTSFAEAIKRKLPPKVAEKLGNGSEIGLNNSNAPIESIGVNSNINKLNGAEAAAIKVAPPPVLAPQNSDSNSIEIEKEVANLTKIVLQQQLALEKVNEKVDNLQLELSQRPRKHR